MEASPYWVNAVMEMVIPLDVSIHASSEEKTKAVEKAFAGIPFPPDSTITFSFEDVEYGEKIEPVA